MKAKAFIAAIALLSGGIFSGIAPTAFAEVPPMNGVYHYEDEDGATATWVIRTSCTSTCVAHVTTSPGRFFEAPLVNGRYAVTRTVPDGHTCPGWFIGDSAVLTESTSHAITVYQWWDPVTLTGEVDFLDSEAPCMNHDAKDWFTLTRIG